MRPTLGKREMFALAVAGALIAAAGLLYGSGYLNPVPRGNVLFVPTASSSLGIRSNEITSKSDLDVLRQASKIEQKSPSYGQGSWKVCF